MTFDLWLLSRGNFNKMTFYFCNCWNNKRGVKCVLTPGQEHGHLKMYLYKRKLKLVTVDHVVSSGCINNKQCLLQFYNIL
jgi:hypothetical protein